MVKREFRVAWEIDVTAESAWGAARKALAILRGPRSTATVAEKQAENGSVLWGPDFRVNLGRNRHARRESCCRGLNWTYGDDGGPQGGRPGGRVAQERECGVCGRMEQKVGRRWVHVKGT